MSMPPTILGKSALHIAALLTPDSPNIVDLLVKHGAKNHDRIPVEEAAEEEAAEAAQVKIRENLLSLETSQE